MICNEFHVFIQVFNSYFSLYGLFFTSEVKPMLRQTVLLIVTIATV